MFTRQRLPIVVGAMAMVPFAAFLLRQMAAELWLGTMLAEPWPRPAYHVAYWAALLCGVPTVLVAGYHLFWMNAEVRTGRRLLANLIGPITVFLPQLWTGKGNRHRRRFLLWIALLGVLVAIAVTCKSLLS